MSPTPSLEPGDVAFPQATWTSFDRYGRYGSIVEALRTSLGPEPLRVLDVGDSAGHLHLFDPGLTVVGLDVELADKPLPDTVRVQADGTRLPFADDTFDAVVSSDVLEHVAPDGRDAFLAELVRVARRLVVVAAPFDTPGVAGCEDLARRYALFSAEAPQPQLEEHRANGLPRLEATRAGLEAGGWATAVAGNGNLWDWLLMMVLRFQLEARPALRPLSEGYDLWYNEMLTTRTHVGPFYRHLVVAAPDGAPDLGGQAGAVDGDGPAPDIAAVLAALIAADTTEAVRQDARVLARDQDARYEQLAARLDHLGERLEALIELEVSMANQIRGLLRPLAKVTRPLRRGSTQ